MQLQQITRENIVWVQTTADKHLSSCPFVNAFFAFSSTTLISFVLRVSPFLTPVLDCNNDWRKQCFFLFSIPGANTDCFIFHRLSRSALPVWFLWFMSLLSSIKIYSFHQQQLQPKNCQHPILCACVGEAVGEYFKAFKLEIYNFVGKKREQWRLAGSLAVFASVSGCF